MAKPPFLAVRLNGARVLVYMLLLAENEQSSSSGPGAFSSCDICQSNSEALFVAAFSRHILQ